MKPFPLEGIVVLRLFCPTLNKDQSHISILTHLVRRMNNNTFLSFQFSSPFNPFVPAETVDTRISHQTWQTKWNGSKSYRTYFTYVGALQKKKKKSKLARGATQTAWPPLPRAVLVQCVPKPVRRGTKHSQPFIALLLMRKCQIPASTQQDVLIYKLFPEKMLIGVVRRAESDSNERLQFAMLLPRRVFPDQE